jgi:hypothetical protein
MKLNELQKMKYLTTKFNNESTNTFNIFCRK